MLREQLSHATLTVCRLRADRDEIARRFAERHGARSDLHELIAATLAEADGLDAGDFADACVDTTDVPASKVAALVRESCAEWPGFHASASRLSAPSVEPDAAADLDTEASGGADGRILLICGPTGVGKSTIGFDLYLASRRGGMKAGYVDLDQLGFVNAPRADDSGSHQLKARNLAAIWQTYHAAGARHVVATGPVQDEAAFRCYADALPGATITLCRLHAGRAELTRRILSRRAGGSWPQPGDPLRGQPDACLRQVAHRAAAEAESLERARLGTLRIDTDGRTPEEAADLIAAAARWPG